jgi:predicted CXXCH cytochrome family protein
VYSLDPNASRCTFCHVGQNGSTAGGRPQWDGRLTTSASNRTSGQQAPDAVDYPPLWHQELTGHDASYAMYQNGSGAPQVGAMASPAIANGRAPGSTSLLCLGCHDGSVAVNWYGNTFQLTGGDVIGKDNYLGNHHPVGFDYDAVRSVRKQIRPADAGYLTATTTVRDHLYGPGNKRMECGTCHSVHNTGNSGETLLWKSDARSRLCLTCHDKGTLAAVP